MENKINCFGRNRQTRRCKCCEYQESCRYYAASAKSLKGHSGFVSFEELEDWDSLAADTDHIPGVEPPRAPEERFLTVGGLAEFFRYLLSLDDYTLGLVATVVGHAAENGKVCSVRELADLHDCSRQAMTRKIQFVVRRYPALKGLLKLTLRKLGNCRSAFLRTGTPGFSAAL